MKMYKVLFGTMLGVVMVFSSVGADEYPSRPIEIIVPYSPGGAADTIARPFVAALQKELNQGIGIINKPGAAGAIGNRLVAQAKPDGYTLLISVVQISVLPLVDTLYGRKPAYQLDQLKGIARLTANPVVIMGRSDKPWKSLGDLFKAAKANPGGIEFSSGGNYAGNHLPMELLMRQAGVTMLNVPYKGGGPSMAAFLGGHVSATAQVPGVAAPHLKSGAARALAQTGGARLKSLPDIPTVKELGYDVEFYLWVGFFAPSGVPDAVMKKLDAASKKAMQDPKLQETADKLLVELGYLNSKEFNAWWAKDAEKLMGVVRSIGKIE